MEIGTISEQVTIKVIVIFIFITVFSYSISAFWTRSILLNLLRFVSIVSCVTGHNDLVKSGNVARPLSCAVELPFLKRLADGVNKRYEGPAKSSVTNRVL